MTEMGTTGRQHPTTAIISLVMGIIGLVALPVIGSIIALVTGYQSRNEAAERPDVYTDDLGRVGRILGWVGLGLSLLGLLIAALVIMLVLSF